MWPSPFEDKLFKIINKVGFLHFYINLCGHMWVQEKRNLIWIIFSKNVNKKYEERLAHKGHNLVFGRTNALPIANH